MRGDTPLHDLDQHPIHLGLGATAVPQPSFAGDMSWYDDYSARHGSDGVEARLVSQHRFAADWDMWEMHPNGSEVVLVIEGELVLHQDDGAGSTSTAVRAGQYAINEPGVWHTADVIGDSATAVFITAGLGTEHRPR